MVSGLRASETAGTSVSQWADTAMIAFGLGNCWPSDARKARAGTSSRIRVGEPCDTKTVGMDIALFLGLPMAACVQSGIGDKEGTYYAFVTAVFAACCGAGGNPGHACHGPDAPAHGFARRHQDSRPGLDHGADHPQPRLHDLRRAVRQGRQPEDPAADGREVRGLVRQAHLDHNLARWPRMA